jgi:hypothetical protein
MLSAAEAAVPITVIAIAATSIPISLHIDDKRMPVPMVIACA